MLYIRKYRPELNFSRSLSNKINIAAHISKKTFFLPDREMETNNFLFWPNVALDEFIHWKIRLAFLRMANSGALRFTSNQLGEDAWLLGLSPIFNVTKLMKNSACVIDFLG